MKRLIKKINMSTNKDLSMTNFIVMGSAFSKKTVFLFNKEEHDPIIVVKIPEDEEGNVRCKVEYEGLGTLSRLRLENIVCSKQIEILNYEGRDCYVQSYETSKPLLDELSLFTKVPTEKTFLFVTDNLIEIYKKSSNQEKEYGKSYSRCFQHGDFWLGNIGRRKKQMVVYDLEFSTSRGTPLYDLIHYGVYYRRVTDNIAKIGVSISGKKGIEEKRQFNLTIEDVVSALLDESKLAKIMRKSIERYIKECKISRQDARALIVSYIEKDRSIKGLSDSWVKKVL